MKPAGLKDFVLITESNRKSAIVIGRTIYTIDGSGGFIQYRGFTTIHPCFTKGKWRIELEAVMKSKNKFWECYFPEDMNRTEWADSWKKKIDKGIEEKNIYINPSDKILTFQKI